MATQPFLNAKDVAYDRPGSVAGYYGWNPSNIGSLVQNRALANTENARNVRGSMEKYLGKRGFNLDSASNKHLVNALDYAYREEGRKQQTKGGGFLDFLKKAIGPVVGAVALGPVGAGLTSAALGGAIGGAVQGGVSDGLTGAALGGLSGYGIGSGVGWASGKLGLSPLTNVNAAVGGDYAARAAAGAPAGNSAASGGLFGSGSNFLTGGGAGATGGGNVGILSSIGGFLNNNPWVGDIAGAGLNYLGQSRANRQLQDAAGRAFSQAQFQPYNINTPLGGASFSGNTATGRLSPEAQATANQLRGLVNTNMGAYQQFNPNNFAQNMYQTMSDYAEPVRTQQTNELLSNVYNRGAWGSTTGAQDIFSLERARGLEDNAFRMQAQQLGAQESDRLFNNYMKSVAQYNTQLGMPAEFINQGLNAGGTRSQAASIANQYPWLAAQTAADSSAAFWSSLGGIASQAFGNAMNRNQQAVQQPTGQSYWVNQGALGLPNTLPYRV